jgi:NADH-quinone oxidoreductase subunit G
VHAIGPEADLTYPVTWLGDDLARLHDLPESFLGAQRPALLLSSRNAHAEVLAACARLPLDRPGWAGFNLVHDTASRVGAMDMGLARSGGLAGLVAAPPRLLFLLGVDDIDLSPFGESFRVYLGSHGDAGARVADVILPGAAYSEKPGTFVNMEGRVQQGFRAVFPPGDAREDWTILRALADVLGVRLPYDTLGALRARIAAEWPHLGQPGLAAFAMPGALPDVLARAAAPKGPIRPRSLGFYQSNPILRASPTMAECAGLAPARLEAAE